MQRASSEQEWGWAPHRSGDRPRSVTLQRSDQGPDRCACARPPVGKERRPCHRAPAPWSGAWAPCTPSRIRNHPANSRESSAAAERAQEGTRRRRNRRSPRWRRRGRTWRGGEMRRRTGQRRYRPFQLAAVLPKRFQRCARTPTRSSSIGGTFLFARDTRAGLDSTAQKIADARPSCYPDRAPRLPKTVGDCCFGAPVACTPAGSWCQIHAPNRPLTTIPRPSRTLPPPSATAFHWLPTGWVSTHCTLAIIWSRWLAFGRPGTTTRPRLDVLRQRSKDARFLLPSCLHHRRPFSSYIPRLVAPQLLLTQTPSCVDSSCVRPRI